MSYDNPAMLQKFHARAKLNYPLLQDVDAQHVTAFGVLNEAYQPGDRAYGVPHPGLLYIGPDEQIRAKFAVPGFRERPPFALVHATIRKYLQSKS